MTTTRSVSLRDRTRDEILALIRSAGELTRGELVDLTGLARSTVTHAVARLISEGSVVESEIETKGPGSGSGRPGTKLRPAGSKTYVAGVDFGHCHIHTAIADRSGTVVAEDRSAFPVDLQAVPALDAATEMIAGLRRRAGIDRVDAVAAGVPGPLNVSTGLVSSPTILSGWVGLAPAEELQRRLGVPVRVANDTFVGAYGELRSGVGRGRDDFLYVKASHGVGACPVINGQPYHGATGVAGEIGHIQVSGHAEVCRCGQRGCLEAVVAMDSVHQQIAHSHPGVDVDEVPLAELDDPITRRILQEAGRTLGRVLADICAVLDPSLIILGGELGGGHAFVEGVTSSINRFIPPGVAAAVQVAPAGLGIRAELTGALALANSLIDRPQSLTPNVTPVAD